MKKLFLIVFLLINAILADAQNWNLINPTDTFHYSHSSDPNHVPVVTVYMDSLDVVIWDLYLFMNRIAEVYDDSMVTNLPHFMMREMIIDTNGLVELHDTASYFIEKLTDVGEEWIFDTVNSIAAMVSLVQNEQFLDTVDSVKTILLSSGDTIKLSLNFGLLRFPDMHNPGQYYELAGIENRIGSGLPGFYDFLTPVVGSTYQYKYTKEIYNPISQDISRVTKTSKYMVTSVSIDAGKVFVQREGLVKYVYKDQSDTTFNYFMIGGTSTFNPLDCMNYQDLFDSYNNQAVNLCKSAPETPDNLWKLSKLTFDTNYNVPLRKVDPYYIYMDWGTDVFPLYMFPDWGLNKVEYLMGIGQKYYHNYTIRNLNVEIVEDTLLGYQLYDYQVGYLYPKGFFYPTDYAYYLPILDSVDYIFTKENDTSFRLKLTVDGISANQIDSIYYLKEEVLSGATTQENSILSDTLYLFNDRVVWQNASKNYLMHRAGVDQWALFNDNLPVAGVVSIEEESFAGVLDTVKTITYFDGTGYEIKLAKHYGLIKYPDFSMPGNHFVRWIDHTYIPELLARIKVFPNPFRDYLLLQGPIEPGLYYELYYQDGRLVQSGYLTHNIQIKNTNALLSGIYVLKIIGQRGSIVKKLIRL